MVYSRSVCGNYKFCYFHFNAFLENDRKKTLLSATWSLVLPTQQACPVKRTVRSLTIDNCSI